MRLSPKLLVAALAFACAAEAAVGTVAAGELTGAGWLAARGVAARGPESWLAGGAGRLALGDDDGGSETAAFGQLHVTLDYDFTGPDPARTFGVFFHGVARAEPDLAEGRAAGIVQAFVYGSLPVRRKDSLRFRLGHFFLPTSCENVEVAWSSPYTITFSALNSWIGEDVRPTGALAEYSLAVGGINELRFGASVFGGNDAAGTLLAWRGWAMGDRLTVYDELVPLPPLEILASGGPFAAQLDGGTRPFGDDLDSRLGRAGYVSFVRPQKARLQWSHYDTRGDRGLYAGQYSWMTEFDLVGFELHATPSWSFAGELLDGSTGMGPHRGPYVQLDMKTSYLLASFAPGPFRLTLRWETFETVDRERAGTRDNNEDGRAWTLAFFWETGPALRLGLELVDLEADRPSAAASGLDPTPDARSATLELRYYFNWK